MGRFKAPKNELDIIEYLHKFWINKRGEILSQGKKNHFAAIADGLLNQREGYNDVALLKVLKPYMTPEYEDDFPMQAYDEALSMGWIRGGHGKGYVYLHSTGSMSTQKVRDITWDVVEKFYNGRVSAVSTVIVDHSNGKTSTYSNADLFESAPPSWRQLLVAKLASSFKTMVG